MLKRCKLTADGCRHLAGRVVNHKRLDAEAREEIRLALLELANRKDEDSFGYCWDCCKKDTCESFKRNQQFGMRCGYCANHEMDGRH